MGLTGTLLWVLAIVCAVWVIYDVVTKHKKMKDVEKLIWIICAVLFSIITAIVYYFTAYKRHK